MMDSARDDTARRVLMRLIGILASDNTISADDFMDLKSQLGYSPL
jgi:hypothetical protein